MFSAGRVLANSPAEVVSEAHADMLKLYPTEKPYIRYLALWTVQEKDRDLYIKILDFHLNSLSREGEFSRVRIVSKQLVALNYKNYSWNPLIWEKLATVDPYFHQKQKIKEDIKLKIVWPGGFDPVEKKNYEPGNYTINKKKGDIIDISAAWIDAKLINDLRNNLLTEAPILRADWFINQTAISTDRVAGYYDWLELGKDEKDFEKLIGANKAESRRLKKEIAAAMAKSGVTLKNRGILRFQSLTGPYWVTNDFKKSTDRKNVIRLLDLDRDPPQGDASEQYGTLPNGLFAFWLQNDKGERQDSAPDFIASDKISKGNDARVHAGKSCIVCHVEGIRPIDDYIRKIYRGAIKLTDPDYDKFLRLRQLYLSDLEEKVKEDQQAYTIRLFKLNGLKPPEVARGYAKAWDKYAEDELTPAQAALELGIKEEDMIAAFKKYASPPPVGVGKIDPVLASLVQVPPVPVEREHWEEIYETAQAIIRGLIP